MTERERIATRCFGCGPDNPSGLHLHFDRDGEGRVASTVTLDEDLCGWDGVAHGGIVSLLLDEVTSWCVALCLAERWFVTRALNVRFLRPTPVGQPLRLLARLVEDRGRTMDLVGEVRLPDGRLTARAKVQFARLDEAQYDAFSRRLAVESESG